MIRWSTPTLPVIVEGIDLTSMSRVAVSFAQGCRHAEIYDPPMSYDAETDSTTLLPTLTQLQTAGFCAGRVDVQVNAVDWMGYRVPTDKAVAQIGSNILEGVMKSGQ